MIFGLLLENKFIYNMKNFLILISTFTFSFLSNAQIQSGPMVGYSDFKEVGLWVQTQTAAKVKINYWEQGTNAPKMSTDEILSEKAHGFAVHLVADLVQPGKKYDYEVMVNGKKIVRDYPLSFQTQALWQYRTEPPTFKFALGSCVYINQAETDRPGQPYGGFYDIFPSIKAQNPDFMIWGGDNLYLRETDWSTHKGIYDRYTHGRSLPELQELLGSVHHYAIWDDHDYGTNDADRGFWNKQMTLDAFKDFWVNPNYMAQNAGTTGTFIWNDCQFFLMDNRWWKAPNENTEANKDYYGKQQLQWLMDNLTTSKATFKFIVTGGQVVNPAKVFENMANYEEENQGLFKAIENAKIPGVLFVSGDRHHTILHKKERSGTYPLYDLTVSPLTSGPSKPKDIELGSSYVEGTLLAERNFATFEVSGILKDRVLKMNIFNTKGELKWTKEIRANELK